MATREVDETEFLTAQAVVRVVNEMSNNPEARKLLLQARKIADPKAIIPEIDAAAPINKEVDELKKIIEEDRKARAQEREEQKLAAATAALQQTWEAQKQALRAQGWRDDGIAAIEKHAQERGIGDLEIAAAHWEKLNPPPDPAQGGAYGNSWDFFGQPAEDDKFVPALLANRGEDEGALNAEIAATLRDVRMQAGSRR